MQETTQPQGEPAQPQRWWVDHNHRVQSGRLVDMANEKSVVSNADGFHVLPLSHLRSSYADACLDAVNRLSNQQSAISKQLAELLAEMAKHSAKGNSAT